MPNAVVVLEDRIDQGQESRRRAGAEVVQSFLEPPAVVTAAEARRLVVDLLEGVLADVADQHRPGAAQPRRVEREAPGVADAERPDLVERRSRQRGHADERVVRRSLVAAGVAVRDAHVDAQHLAEQRAGPLRLVLWIAAGAAVAHADVEIPVRPERDLAAVVVAERLADGALRRRCEGRAAVVGGHVGLRRPQQVEARVRIGDQRVGGRSEEARHDRVPVTGAGEVHVEPAGARVVAREGEAEQAALAAARDRRRQVQEIGALQHAVADHPDQAALLHDELHRRIGRILDHADR